LKLGINFGIRYHFSSILYRKIIPKIKKPGQSLALV